MRLEELVGAVEGAGVVGDASVEVTSLAYDSRRAGAGTLFFCVRGERRDGHEFAAAAVAAGAVGLVVERRLEASVAQVVVPDARAAMAPLAARFWGDPSAELRVAGVTGTNGKTTTAFLVREILEAAAIGCGLLGTVKQVVGGAEEEVERTTPEAIDLQGSLRRMLDAGDRACAMEVSSHALEQHRCDAIRFEAALFVNLTQDHLDYHGDMESYFGSKRRLFEMGPRAAIVNVDDPYGRRLVADPELDLDWVTYSAAGREAHFIARDIELAASGARFEILEAIGDETISVEAGRRRPPARTIATRLPGRFNVANALAAFAVARAFGIAPDVAAAALAAAPPPPGRLEPIEEGQGFAVLVDYAHTPDALANVLAELRQLTAGRVISVFGAGGDRDAGKRPQMGRAGAELSDLAIVTSDNPRSERPEAIVEQVLAGAGKRDGVEAEVDRRAAIALALERARPGDTVLIAGKGHEQGQEFEDGRTIPFDDREVAREELRKLGGAP